MAVDGNDSPGLHGVEHTLRGVLWCGAQIKGYALALALRCLRE